MDRHFAELEKINGVTQPVRMKQQLLNILPSTDENPSAIN